MTKNILFLIVICVTVINCDGKNKNLEDDQFEGVRFEKSDFRKRVSLKANPFIIDDLGIPVRITVSEEEEKIFITSTGFDYWARVFDLNGGGLVGEFSRKGQGPGELISAFDIQILSDQKLAAINGMMNNRIDLFELEDIYTNSKPSPIESYNLKDMRIQQPKILNKGLLVDLVNSYGGDSKNRLHTFSKDGFVGESFGEYPSETMLEKNDKHKSSVFEAKINISSSRNFIGVAYDYTDVIEIYNSQKDLVVRLWGPDQFKPMLLSQDLGGGASTVSATRDARNAYTIPVLNDENLLVLYDGRSVTENGYHQTQILWFGIDGTAKYILDLEVPIFAFDVDWKNKVLYGLTHDYEKDNIEVAVVKYDLSGL